MEKLNNIKIVFIDIDGTLVNKRKRITFKTRKSINRIVNKGILVVLTSGRDFIHTMDKSKRSLGSNIVISSNGAEIYDYKNMKEISVSRIPADKINKIWDYCNQNKIGLFINSISGKYINKYLIGKDKETGILVTSKKELKKIIISQFVLTSNEIEKMTKAKEYIESIDLSITSYSESFLDSKIDNRYRLDVNNQNINKGIAVSTLLKYLNIKKEESLCFGDYLNDLEMFESCGITVAMGNACNALKEKADCITKTNNENGVADFLNKYL